MKPLITWLRMVLGFLYFVLRSQLDFDERSHGETILGLQLFTQSLQFLASFGSQ